MEMKKKIYTDENKDGFVLTGSKYKELVLVRTYMSSFWIINDFRNN